MLAGAYDARFQIIALDAAHVRDRHPRDEINVLAEGLFAAAPSRVAGDVGYRSQSVARADGEHLSADDGAHFFDQVGREGGGERQRHRKAGRVLREEAGATFLMEDRGDREARFLDEDALNRVHRARGFLGRHQRAVARDLADAALQHFARAIGVEATVADHPPAPQRAELRDFLLERHAREQVPDALVDRQGGVLVVDGVSH